MAIFTLVIPFCKHMISKQSRQRRYRKGKEVLLLSYLDNNFLVTGDWGIVLIGLLFFVNLTKARVTWEEKPQLRKRLQQITCRQMYRAFF